MSRIQSIRTLISASIAALAMLPAFAHAQESTSAPITLEAIDYRMNEHVVQVPAGSDDVNSPTSSVSSSASAPPT